MSQSEDAIINGQAILDAVNDLRQEVSQKFKGLRREIEAKFDGLRQEANQRLDCIGNKSLVYDAQFRRAEAFALKIAAVGKHLEVELMVAEAEIKGRLNNISDLQKHTA